VVEVSEIGHDISITEPFLPPANHESFQPYAGIADPPVNTLAIRNLNGLGSAGAADNPEIEPKSLALSALCTIWADSTVFYARLYVGVGRLNEVAEGCGGWGCSRPQLHMAHEFPGPFQQARRIRQRSAVKETYVHVGSKDIHVREGRIAHAGNRTAVMHELADLVSAISHHLKPLARQVSQIAMMRIQPGIDGGIVLDCTIEPQDFRFHRRSIFALAAPSLARGMQHASYREQRTIRRIPPICVHWL
jgi:hypothetical protein